MNMPNLNSSNEILSDDPTWCVIAEYSLGEVSVGENIKAGFTLGSLYKTLRDLGIQPGYLNKLEETITGIAEGASVHSHGGGPSSPVLIRLLCQSVSVESLSHLEKYKNGGWGYYLIERGLDIPAYPHQERLRVVELYLYKEGE